MALLSYFAALRPIETFAMHITDFLTGDIARRSAPTYQAFEKLGLGSGLTVHINKSTAKRPNKKYHGYVNVWHKDAAVLLADRLPTQKEQGSIFKGTATALHKRWEKTGQAALRATLFDLRMASGNYLGKEVGVDLVTLNEHMRHSEIGSTLLYTKKPAPKKWEDVA